MSLKLLLVIIIILFVIITVFFWMRDSLSKDTIEKLYRENSQLERDKKLAERWQEQWYKHYIYFYNLSEDLGKKNKVLTEENSKLKNNGFNTFTIDKEIETAVRFAMIHSHPDKGGKEEDFIRFHALYKKIKDK